MRKNLTALGLLLLTVGCTSPPQVNKEKARDSIDSLMDRWHRAAAEADDSTFFRSMTRNGIYLGTDPEEKWSRTAFQEWAAPHFKGAEAWSFKPETRTIYFNQTGNTAWFEEKLETWMGTCRGSGVLVRKNGHWKIAHYHLDKTLPNEKMDTVLSVLGIGNE